MTADEFDLFGQKLNHWPGLVEAEEADPGRESLLPTLGLSMTTVVPPTRQYSDPGACKVRTGNNTQTL